jgi:hypothetical protein
MRAAVAAAMGALTALVGMSAAAADTRITEPSEDPVTVTVADDGWPAAVTVKADGFEPFQSVYIEQCNDRTPEDADWSPAIDCDPGSAPAAAIADESGVVVFAADDPNHAFRPFVGASPQRSFNCLGPDAPSPDNELEQDFRECQIRVSSNNTRSTSDQVFLRIELPNKAKEWSPEIVPGAVTSDQPGSGSQTASGSGATETGSGKDGASNELASSGSDASDSESDGSAAPAIFGLVLAAAALGVGGFLLVRRRRTRAGDGPSRREAAQPQEQIALTAKSK